MESGKAIQIVKEGLGVALAERCMTENRYPTDVAREWLILNPYAATHFVLSELVDLTVDCITMLESED